MKAIVCDKCGKTVLLEDSHLELREINKLYLGKEEVVIDLCDECTDELMDALRKENDYERVR